jgi:hypothetical protein
MTKMPKSSNVPRQMSGLARRLRDNPNFMARVLAVYQEQERLGDDALAEHLHTTPATLARLAVCKRPDSSSPQFADQVRQISTYTNIDPAQLANIVRQVDSLEKLSELPRMNAPEEADAPQGWLQPGLLAAARDRSESTEDRSSSSEEDETPPED